MASRTPLAEGRMPPTTVNRQNVAVVDLLSSAITSICSIVFALLLVYFYATYVSVTFAYMGHHWDPNYFGIATGTITVGAIALYLPGGVRRAGDILVYVLFLMAFVPSMVIPSTFSSLTTNDLLTFQLILAACFLIILIANSTPGVRLDFAVFTPRGYRVFLVGLWILMIVPIVIYMGVPSSIPGLGGVYEVRFQARESMASAPTVVAFLYTMMARVVSKFLFVYGLIYRKPLFLSIGLITSVYLYGVSGHRSFLFQLGLYILLILGMAIFRNRLASLIAPALLILVLSSALVDFLMNSDWLRSLLVRRTFIVPGILSGYYHEFFSNNPNTQWAYSFLGSVGRSPYESTPPFLIGEYYFNNPATSANASIWADGFANFGYVGMLVATIVAGIVIWIINSAALGRPLKFVLPLTTVVLMVFVSTSVFTSLVTHGVILLILLVVLCPAESTKRLEGDDVLKGSLVPNSSKSS